MSYLPYSRPVVLQADIDAVVDALRDPMISQGRRLAALEEGFCAVTGSAWSVALSSGTAALHAMCVAAGLGAGDEVILPALTFAGTANAVRYTGAKPVFADIDPQSRCIDPGAVGPLISPQTRAVIAVDFAGHPADYSRLRSIANENGLLLLSDAAHAPGAQHRGTPVGSLGDMTAFSLNPVKNITGAEGGVVVGSENSHRDVVGRFRSHGITRDERLLENDALGQNGWYYEQQLLGFNYKLSELHAALALSQLERLDAVNRHRATLAQFYTRRLAHLPLRLPVAPEHIEHAWHLYVVQLEAADFELRNRIFSSLRAEGIGVQLHYIPVPMHPDYQRSGYRMKGLPHTDAYYRSAFSLPLHAAMDESDCERVAATLEALL